MVLERFPDYVVEQVTDPLTGIQRTSKFAPSIAEVVAICDEIVRSSTYAAQWEARAEQQLEERRQFEELQKAESLEQRQEVWERCKREMRTHGFVFPEDRTTAPRSLSWKQYSSEELLKMYPLRKSEP
jgi:hypothetical protein